MIKISNKSNCYGCGSCENICPESCIAMKSDAEGFLYPTIETEKCINCGLCEKGCPELNVKPDSPKKQEFYVVQALDDKVRRGSTSGGAFTPIAEYVIRQGGVVFGAAFVDKINFEVRHQYVETIDEIGIFRGSKYVQSSMGDSYKKAKEFLDASRMVCFSGTPCQVEGLYSFLRNDYENLITVDVVCRAVPSPLVFKKYLEVQRKHYGDDIENIRFRDKYYGYGYSTMSIYVKKNSAKKDYHRGIESDLYLRTFFSGICDRPSCGSCSFRKQYHISDFTIWDCFSVGKIEPKMDDDRGTSRISIQTDNGREVFHVIKKNFNFKEYTPIMSGECREVAYSETLNFSRTEFFSDIVVLKVE